MEMPKLSRPQTRNPDATPDEIRAWHAEWAEYEIATGKNRDAVLQDKHTIPVHVQRDALPKREPWGHNPTAQLEAPYFRCPMCPEYRDIHAGGMVRAGQHITDAHGDIETYGDMEFFSLPDSSVDPMVDRKLEVPAIGNWSPYESEAA